MVTPGTCHIYAKEHFDREWQAACDSLEGDRHLAQQRLSHIEWLTPDLLALLEEFRDRPTSELTPLIRRLLAEQSFIDENGDSVIDECELAMLEHEVRLVVEVLDRVRSRCRDEGRWAGTPTTPQMFG